MPLLAQLNMGKQLCRVPIFGTNFSQRHSSSSSSKLFSSVSLSDLNGSLLHLMTRLSLNVEQWAQQRATPWDQPPKHQTAIALTSYNKWQDCMLLLRPLGWRRNWARRRKGEKERYLSLRRRLIKPHRHHSRHLPSPGNAVNKGCHLIWPSGDGLALLFALLICMLMCPFYGSTVSIHCKINYPSGKAALCAGWDVY